MIPVQMVLGFCISFLLSFAESLLCLYDMHFVSFVWQLLRVCDYVSSVVVLQMDEGSHAGISPDLLSAAIIMVAWRILGERLHFANTSPVSLSSLTVVHAVLLLLQVLAKMSIRGERGTSNSTVRREHRYCCFI